MLDLSSHHLTLVRAILNQYVPHARVVAFGSRVKGTAKPYSDLDLAIIANTPLSFSTRTRLKEAFSESDLPFMVDIADWHRLAPNIGLPSMISM